MPDNLNKSPSKRTFFRPSTFSRRQALQRMGITVGTGMMATLSFMAACKKSGQTTTPTVPTTPSSATSTPTTSRPVTSATATTTQPPIATTTALPTDTAAQTTPASSTQPPVSTTSPPPGTTGFNYLPPTTPPPLVDVPESECTVATDRHYSLEHVWVKTVAPDIVILGITTTMVAILGEPFRMTFPEVGNKLARDDGFAEIEGYKVTADLIVPVSGEVIQINTFLKTFVGQHIMEPLINDTYNTGWMIAIKLSNPQEINDLMTWEQYMERLGKA
jgi:glycine cleavage system H protein